jgi:hypothetical protein
MSSSRISPVGHISALIFECPDGPEPTHGAETVDGPMTDDPYAETWSDGVAETWDGGVKLEQLIKTYLLRYREYLESRVEPEEDEENES